MLWKVVEYLRSNGVPFRLESFPSPEQVPQAVYGPRPRDMLSVDTWIVTADGRLSLVCVPKGERIDPISLRASLGAEIVQEAALSDLPSPFGQSTLPAPPLGRMFGVPVIVDERIAQSAAVIGFEAFSPNDYVLLTFDDFSRLEQPRVLDVARGGELPQSAGEGPS